jgi:hypothetical protein
VGIFRLYGVMNENQSDGAKSPVANSRLALASRQLGYWGIIPATLVIPMLFIADHFWTGMEVKHLALACIVVSAITGVAAMMCGLMAPFSKLPSGPEARIGIGFSLLTLLLVMINLAVMPHFVRPIRIYTWKNGCINNLRQIDGAKEQWMLEHKKNLTNTPTWNDLIDTNGYLREVPKCPANGTYTIGNMSTKPRCNITDHTLQ